MVLIRAGNPSLTSMSRPSSSHVMPSPAGSASEATLHTAGAMTSSTRPVPGCAANTYTCVGAYGQVETILRECRDGDRAQGRGAGYDGQAVHQFGGCGAPGAPCFPREPVDKRRPGLPIAAKTNALGDEEPSGIRRDEVGSTSRGPSS